MMTSSPESKLSADQVVELFCRMCEDRHLARRGPQSLIEPCFAVEFNRCVEHTLLNEAIRCGQQSPGLRGWYEVAPVCRINDMRKVESGKHSTVFEVLTLVKYYDPPQARQARWELTGWILDFLVGELGLEKHRVWVTYFGGGPVLPGLSREADALWRDAWLDLGLPSSNLLQLRGLKNYVLFAAEGERCGPKSEIFYDLGHSSEKSMVEIGTAIVDEAWIDKDGGGWHLQPATRIASGVAFGLERLVAACHGTARITEVPEYRALYQTVLANVEQPAEVVPLLYGDVLILVDQVRACCYLLAEGVIPDSSARGRALLTMLRRIRRKVAILCLRDWPAVLQRLEEQIVERHARRHPRLNNCRNMLVRALEALQWPESWNPDSYRSAEGWLG